MKVDLIHQVIDQYVRQRDSAKVKILIDSIVQFQSHWDPVALDFVTMYDRAISESYIQMRWKTRPKKIKEAMVKMIQRDRQSVQQMFQDLLYPRVSLSSRIEHFIADCERIFQPLYHIIDLDLKNHGHDDLEVIFMYLCFHEPSRNFMYQYDSLRLFLDKIQARNIPEPSALDDQLKVHSILHNFLSKNDSYQKWLEDQGIEEYSKYKFALTSDLILFF